MLIRDVFAILGALASALVLLVVLMLLTWRAPNDSRPPRSPSLQDAQVLLSMAGVKPGDAKELRGGVNGPWDDAARVEAYCVAATGDPDAAGWGSPGELEPLLASAAVAAIDSAHAALPCFPAATQVADAGWRVKLIGANFSGGTLEEARVAVRDPASGDYFLVYARHPLLPPTPQPVARALL